MTMSGPSTAAQAGNKTHASDAVKYGEQPPRLIAALNDTQAPADSGVKHSDFDEEKQWPRRHVLADSTAEAKSTAIGSILKWVASRLDADFGEVWASQDGPTTKWSKGASDPEERWARMVSERLLGIDYYGSEHLYAFGSAARIPPHRAESWRRYVFHRIERRYARTKLQRFVSRSGKDEWYGAYDVGSWRDPIRTETASSGTAPTTGSKPPETDTWSNDDPALPIGCACEYLSTFVALMRGIPLEWLGSDGAPRFGLMASDAIVDYSVFGGQSKAPADGLPSTAPDSPGRWYGAVVALPPEPRVDGAPLPPPRYASQDLLDVKKSIAERKLAPGTVFVWDPDTGPLPRVIKLWVSKYEWTDARRNRTVTEYFKTRKTAGGADFADWGPNRTEAPKYEEECATRLANAQSSLKAKRDQLARKIAAKAPDHEINALKQAVASAEANESNAKELAQLAQDNKTSPQDYIRNQQLPGSHIAIVLRVKSSNDAVQLMDTTKGEQDTELKKTGAHVICDSSDLLCDSERLPTADNTKGQLSVHEGKSFAGMGVMPVIPITNEQLDHIAKARPVGLVRFAITTRATNPKTLYVSRLRPMYGKKQTENYWVSKLLWSMRNVPGFSNLQVWWFVFSPLSWLAKAMWAGGDGSPGSSGRDMSLHDFCMRYKERAVSGTPEGDRVFRFLTEGTFSFSSKPPSEAARKKLQAQASVGLYFGKHYDLRLILTNCGEEAPGRVKVFARFKVNQAGGSETEGPVPLISELKGQVTKPNFSWNDIFVAPELESQRAAIESATPEWFQSPVPK